MRQFVFCLCAALLWASVAGQELLPNGTFETGASNNTKPANWTPFTPPAGQTARLTQSYRLTGGVGDSRCIEVGYSYENYTELTFDDEDFARYRLDSGAAVNVNAAGYYRFQVQYRTQNINANGQVSVELQWFNGTSFIDVYNYSFGPAADWTPITIHVRPIRASDRGFDQVDANRLRIQLGVISSLGTAFFDNASLQAVDLTTYNNNLPLNTFVPNNLTGRRQRAPRFTPAPAWTIRRDANNAWWFVRPDGTPVWWRMVQNILNSGTENPQLFANLNPAFKSGANTTAAYVNNSRARLGTLNFNANVLANEAEGAGRPFGRGHMVGLWTDPGATTPGGFYDPAWLLRDKNGNFDSANKPMPDPWNPDFRAWRRNHTRAILNFYPTGVFGGEDFVGYFTDNEMGVERLDQFIWSTHAQNRFIQFCRDLYGNNIQALNTAWSSPYATFNFTSFDQIPTRKADIVRHHLDDPLTPVLNRFIIEMLKELYRVNCAAIREYEVEKLGDANGDGLAERKHLIATNRFDFSRYPNRYTIDMELVMIALAELRNERPGFHFDLIAVNNYPGDGRFEGIVTLDNFFYLETIANYTQLPVLISEFGVHGRDAGFPTGNDVSGSIGWFWRSVNSQTDRARTYDKMMRQWASSPFIIGAQWFQWFDLIQDVSGPLTAPVPIDSPLYRGRNSGVVNFQNNFYTQLTNQMLATNNALDAAFLPNVAAPRNAADTGWALLD